MPFLENKYPTMQAFTPKKTAYQPPMLTSAKINPFQPKATTQQNFIPIPSSHYLHHTLSSCIFAPVNMRHP